MKATHKKPMRILAIILVMMQVFSIAAMAVTDDEQTPDELISITPSSSGGVVEASNAAQLEEYLNDTDTMIINITADIELNNDIDIEITTEKIIIAGDAGEYTVNFIGDITVGISGILSISRYESFIISGSFTNNGEVHFEGSITGEFINNGEVTLGKSAIAGNFDNNGEVIFGYSGNVSFITIAEGATFTNSGILTLSGDTSSGNWKLESWLWLYGDLLNDDDGTIINNGVIQVRDAGNFEMPTHLDNTNGLIIGDDTTNFGSNFDFMTFDTNGGTIYSKPSLVLAEEIDSSGTKFKLPKIEYLLWDMWSPQGKVFNGWYTLATGGEINDMTNTAYEGAGETLYAQWVDALYQLSIEPSSTYTFANAVPGYSTVTPLIVTVTNTGNVFLKDINITLEGANPGSFTLSTELLININPNGEDTFTVVPVAELVEGTYEATVKVAGTTPSGASTTAQESFDVSFTVARFQGAAVSGAPTVSGTPTQSSITVNAVDIPDNPGSQTVEYAIGTSATIEPIPSGWGSSLTFGGLLANRNYYVWARSAANTAYQAGEAQRSAAIRTAEGDPAGFEEDADDAATLEELLNNNTTQIINIAGSIFDSTEPIELQMDKIIIFTDPNEWFNINLGGNITGNHTITFMGPGSASIGGTFDCHFIVSFRSIININNTATLNPDRKITVGVAENGGGAGLYINRNATFENKGEIIVNNGEIYIDEDATFVNSGTVNTNFEEVSYPGYTRSYNGSITIYGTLNDSLGTINNNGRIIVQETGSFQKPTNLINDNGLIIGKSGSNFGSGFSFLTFNGNGGTVYNNEWSSLVMAELSGSTFDLTKWYWYMGYSHPDEYAFLGWYTAATGGTKINLQEETAYQGATLFAQWAVATTADELIAFLQATDGPDELQLLVYDDVSYNIWIDQDITLGGSKTLIAGNANNGKVNMQINGSISGDYLLSIEYGHLSVSGDIDCDITVTNAGFEVFDSGGPGGSSSSSELKAGRTINAEDGHIYINPNKTFENNGIISSNEIYISHEGALINNGTMTLTNRERLNSYNNTYTSYGSLHLQGTFTNNNSILVDLGQLFISEGGTFENNGTITLNNRTIYESEWDYYRTVYGTIAAGGLFDNSTGTVINNNGRIFGSDEANIIGDFDYFTLDTSGGKIYQDSWQTLVMAESSQPGGATFDLRKIDFQPNEPDGEVFTGWFTAEGERIHLYEETAYPGAGQTLFARYATGTTAAELMAYLQGPGSTPFNLIVIPGTWYSIDIQQDIILGANKTIITNADYYSNEGAVVFIHGNISNAPGGNFTLTMQSGRLVTTGIINCNITLNNSAHLQVGGWSSQDTTPAELAANRTINAANGSLSIIKSFINRGTIQSHSIRIDNPNGHTTVTNRGTININSREFSDGGDTRTEHGWIRVEGSLNNNGGRVNNRGGQIEVYPTGHFQYPSTLTNTNGGVIFGPARSNFSGAFDFLTFDGQGGMVYATGEVWSETEERWKYEDEWYSLVMAVPGGGSFNLQGINFIRWYITPPADKVFDGWSTSLTAASRVNMNSTSYPNSNAGRTLYARYLDATPADWLIERLERPGDETITLITYPDISYGIYINQDITLGGNKTVIAGTVSRDRSVTIEINGDITSAITGDYTLTMRGGALSIAGAAAVIDCDIILKDNSRILVGFDYMHSYERETTPSVLEAGRTIFAEEGNFFIYKLFENKGTIISSNILIYGAIVENSGSIEIVSSEIKYNEYHTEIRDGNLSIFRPPWWPGNRDGQLLNNAGTVINNGIIAAADNALFELPTTFDNDNGILLGASASNFDDKFDFMTLDSNGGNFSISWLWENIIVAAVPKDTGFNMVNINRLLRGWHENSTINWGMRISGWFEDAAATGDEIDRTLTNFDGKDRTIYAFWQRYSYNESFAIALNRTGLSSVSKTYANADADVSVTIENIGNQIIPAGALTVELSDESDFTLSTKNPNVNNLGTGRNNNSCSFTIIPNRVLDVGVYTVTVTVSGSDRFAGAYSASFDLLYTVNRRAGATLRAVPEVDLADRKATELTVSNIPAMTPETVNNPGGQIIQYAITTSDSSTAPSNLIWQNNPKFEGLRPETRYFIWALTAANENCNAGTARRSSAGISTTAPVQQINLPVSGVSGGIHTFKEAAYNYAAIPELSVRVNSTGTGTSGDLKVTLSGFDALDFELDGLEPGNELLSINAGANRSFTIKPKQDLDVGTYTATVTVAGTGDGGNNAAEQSFMVRFSVTRGTGARVTAATEDKTKTTETSITVNAAVPAVTGQPVQYAITTSDRTTMPSNLVWQNGLEFTGLLPNTTYYVWARTAATSNYTAGTGSQSAGMKTDQFVYDISLSRAGTTPVLTTYAFTPAGTFKSGAQPPAALNVNVKNIGKSTYTGDMEVTLTGIAGSSPESFVLGTNAPGAPLALSGIPAVGGTFFTVRPAPNSVMTGGIHEALVTVRSLDAPEPFSESFVVRFTVERIAGTNLPATAVPILADRTSTSITVYEPPIPATNDGQTLEYAITKDRSTTTSFINGLQWQSFEMGSPLCFENLDPSTNYYVWARLSQNHNYNAGTARRSDVIQTEAPNYLVTLGRTADYTFKTSKTFGANPPAALTVRIDNKGKGDSTELDIILSGGGADHFELSKIMTSNIPGDPMGNGESDTFTVRPKANVPRGAYTATVTVSGTNGIVGEFDVSFTVNGRGKGAALATAPVAVKTEDKEDRSITVANFAALAPESANNPGKQNVQYAITTNKATKMPSGLRWQSEPVFEGLQANTTYYVWARMEQSIDSNAGTARRSGAVTTDWPLHGVTLNRVGVQTFKASSWDYKNPPGALSVTVRSRTMNNTGELTVTLGGANPGAFYLSGNALQMGSTLLGIDNGKTRSFNVRPTWGLPAGEYNATVTVSGFDNIRLEDFEVSFDVKFTVNRTKGATVNSVPIASAVTANSIEVLPVLVTGLNEREQFVEYTYSTSSATSAAAIRKLDAEDNWTTFDEGEDIIFEGLKPDTTYYIFARSEANPLSLRGDARRSAAIRTDKADIDFTLSRTSRQLFATVSAGYATQQAISVTVTNTGKESTGTLTIGLEGDNPGSFTLSQLSITIPAHSSRTFTIRPEDEVGEGQHNAVVVVSDASETVKRSFDVRFTVRKVAGAALASVPEVTARTHDSITVGLVDIDGDNQFNQVVEYAIGRTTTTPADNTATVTNWVTADPGFETITFDGLQLGVAYYIFARTKANDFCNTGAVRRSILIQTLSEAT